MLEIRSMEKARPVQPDLHESRLQTWFYRTDFPEIDIAHHALGIGILKQQFHEFAVLKHGDAHRMGGRIDDDFFFHEYGHPAAGRHGSAESVQNLSVEMPAQPAAEVEFTYFLKRRQPSPVVV